MSNIVKFILFFSVCLSVCVASKLKCAKACNKVCPNIMLPCPLGVLCPRGTTLNRSEGGCCCEADDRPEGPKQPSPRACPGTHEVFDICGPGCGDPRCRIKRICPRVCVEGCYCERGYARDSNNACIPIELCDAEQRCSINKNETYKLCLSACTERTCNFSGAGMSCPDVCIPGCYCNGGFVRYQGVCIFSLDCPDNARCPDINEVYKVDCLDQNCPPGLMCPAVCGPSCICRDGFERNDQGTCVPIKNCESTCTGKFESCTECGSGCGDFNCGDDLNRMCPAVCRSGCYCDSGYARNEHGNCIPINECPAKCGANQIYNECGSACGDFTCDNYGQPRRCTKNCVAGCYCAKDYVMFNGECIPFNKCPAGCKLHEEYSECGSNGCQNTCANPTLGQVCRAICQSGCICVEGYLRDEEGECVREDLC